jgi:hypothetical protein
MLLTILREQLYLMDYIDEYIFISGGRVDGEFMMRSPPGE